MTFLFLWGATTNFLLPLTGVSVGTLRMTFCSPSSFKLSSSVFWKLFSSSVNWLSKSLFILSFCKLNERSSLPSAKWRLSFFYEKIGFNISYQLGSFSGAKPLPCLHLADILRHSAFSVVYFLQSFPSEVSNGVYSLTTPFAFVKLSTLLTSIKWFSLRFWSNIFWISVKASSFAAFFRACSSRAVAKLCSSSAKTPANNVTSTEVQFRNFFRCFCRPLLPTCFDVLIKCFNQKCFDENIFITYAGYCFYAKDYMHMLST